VPEQDVIATEVICGGFECCVPGIAGCSFRPEPSGCDLHRAHFYRCKPQIPQYSCRPGSYLCRASLKLMVNHDASHGDRVPVHMAAPGEVSSHSCERK
jgi:hypothetical protein